MSDPNKERIEAIRQVVHLSRGKMKEIGQKLLRGELTLEQAAELEVAEIMHVREQTAIIEHNFTEARIERGAIRPTIGG